MAKLNKLPKSRDRYLEAQVLNIKTYQDFYARLARIAMSMFEWENLPESMDGEFLERCLFFFGQAALLYKADYGGYVNTQSVVHGKLNLYYKPVSLECYGPDNVNVVRSVYNGLEEPKGIEEECILVENMMFMIPTASTLDLYAMRMAEVQRSEDVNIKQQKFPMYIQTDQKQRFSIENTYDQYAGNTPVIVADKTGMTSDSFRAVNTEVPYVADKLQQYRLKIFNEALSFLGVNNLNEKKERQLTSEIEKNNEEVNLNLQAFLVPRQRAARQFNRKYGFTGTDKEIKVKIRSDLYNVIKTEQSVVAGLSSDPTKDDK